MGDILLTTPLLRQTRQSFPNAEIHYLLAAPFRPVLERNSSIDRVETFDPAIFTRLQLGGFIRLARRIRSGDYDCIFVLDKHWSFALCAWLAGVRLRMGFLRDKLVRFFLNKTIPYGPLRHEVHYYLDLLAILTRVDYKDGKLEFDYPKDLTLPLDVANLERPFVVCMNSGGKNIRENSGLRRLPSPLFVQLLTIIQCHYDVVLLGAKDDSAYFQSLDLPRHLDLSGQLTLAESIQVMANAARIYTTECGALHMAATTNTPITVYYGPTHPRRRTPLGCSVEEFWTDEAIYDDAYETHGVLPAGKSYFRNLILKEITPPISD